MTTTIKIKSNPYEKEISYYSLNEVTNGWENIIFTNYYGKLREDDSENFFLPFKIKDIIDVIIDEYYTGKSKVSVVFEGTSDEYKEVQNVCNAEDVIDKIELSKSDSYIENAKYILKDTKEQFLKIKPIIQSIVKDDEDINKGLNKVSDALDDIIPVCVFGNYSAGKSTFINALVGYEILPSGGDPVTAKVYRIACSEDSKTAEIRFEHYYDDITNSIEIYFDDDGYRLRRGEKTDKMLIELDELLADCPSGNLILYVNKTLDFINSYEKKDKTSIEISNIVELDIPFNRNGVLGQSAHKFVIFDTPGSNSNTNMDHSEVLTKALDGFSNGIPVWVSQYDSIDSKDNAELCKKLYEIDALDKRFTMIVVNKADSVELPKTGLTNSEINNIMDYDAVNKMYASGIFFVSSFMGFGAKNKDGFINEYAEEIYEEKERKFSDPEMKSYKMLYRYNIMPEQMKTEAISKSEQCDNLIYANSGLYCVESEMENFASDYAAYNKCQMVYLFLDRVIEDINQEISKIRKSYADDLEECAIKLGDRKKELLGELEVAAKNLDSESEKYGKINMKVLVRDHLDYHKDTEDFEKIDNDIFNQKGDENNLNDAEKDMKDSKSNMWANLKSNSQNLTKAGLKDTLKSIKDDFVKDYKELQDKKEIYDDNKQRTDSSVSDEVLDLVTEEYKRNVVDAKDRIEVKSKEYWLNQSDVFRDHMVNVIVGTSALSETEREEVKSAIMDYKPLEFLENPNDMFVKSKYLRGTIFGFKINSSERLNIKKLVSSYNSKMKATIKEMADRSHSSGYASFKLWEEELKSIITNNITSYNPELKKYADRIAYCKGVINGLDKDKKTISDSYQLVENLLGWQED